jgi:hypothetical protein
MKGIDLQVFFYKALSFLIALANPYTTSYNNNASLLDMTINGYLQ